MSTPRGAFIWYELMTSDINAAARFYNSVVGWQIPQQRDPRSGERDYRMIRRSDGGNTGGMLQLTSGMQQGGARPDWLGYLQVADVDEAVRAMEQDGAHAHLRLSLPVGDIAMVTDPLGSPFYVMRPIPPPDQPDARSDAFDTAALQHVTWNELVTPDLARAEAFYAKHFGYAFNDTMPMGELGDYCFFDLDNVRLGALMQQHQAVPFTGWNFYFSVPSVLAARRAIEAGGGRVVIDPQEVPGGHHAMVASDPQGAIFGIAGPLGE
jgi:predicted enzyme related to lactoylglutathione lyase